MPEAAAALAVSEASLQKAWKAGIGPPSFLLNRRRLVPIDGLRTWLRVQSGQEEARP